VILFPTAVKRNFTFRVYQQSILGNYAYSEPMTIEITSERYENKTYEEWLRLRIDGLPADDTNNSEEDLNETIEAIQTIEAAVAEYGTNLTSEESLEILGDFSKFHLLSYNFYYGWFDDQIAAFRNQYLPSDQNKRKFLEKKKFTARIKSVNNGGKTTIKFDTALRD
jgi:hypothetical protein